MLFLNPLLLIGLLGIAIPIAVHLWGRGARRTMPWGAMRFLQQSMTDRARRIELEDTLLMAARCAAVGAIALALARPFVPPGARVPWAVVLPLVFCGAVALAFAGACWGQKRRRWGALIATTALFGLAAAAVFFEREWNLSRLGGRSGGVALIIDASTSMATAEGGETRFEQACAEAREIIAKADDDTAFVIVLAGPSPALLSPTPTASRETLERQLTAARVADGGMALPEALRAAAGALEAFAGARRAVLISDGGGEGWRADDRSAWAQAGEAFSAKAGKTQLALLDISTGAERRNLSVAAIETVRPGSATGSAAEFRVEIRNTGTEAVTPDGVQLRIGNTLLENQTVGQLLPGQAGSATFEHRPERSGGQVLSATVLVDDALGADNTMSRAISVGAGPRVLVGEGRPGAQGFDRAAAFVELALSASNGGAAPVSVAATAFPSAAELANYDAVILADVPRLAAADAAALDAWTAAGGGLLIAPGKSSAASFYNAFTPAITAAKLETIAGPTAPAPVTFDHNLLHEGGDLGSISADRHWVLQPAIGAAQIAEFTGGAPMIVRGEHGSGTVIVSALPLDNSMSNFASRASFLPLVHELVGSVAAGGIDDLHLAPSTVIELALPITGAGRYGVLDPLGAQRDAEVADGIARISGAALVGVYELGIPESARERCGDLLTPAGTIPFTVARPIGELEMTPVSEADKTRAAAHFELLQADSADDVAAALEGTPFGVEMWRNLALLALLLLTVEPALARWVTRSRKTGEHQAVDFTTRPSSGR